MSFQIHLSPLDLSLYSGQNSCLSWHPPWCLGAPGEAHRVVAPQQSECHGHLHFSSHIARPCWNQLSSFSFAFSGGWFLPQTQSENSDHAEWTQAISSPLSMTVAQGLQMQPELGHLPVRDHHPSLLLFLPWPKWRFHPVLSQSSLVLQSVLPFTFLSPRSGMPANPSNYFSNGGSDTSCLFLGLLF